jgi:hypothetical protein
MRYLQAHSPSKAENNDFWDNNFWDHDKGNKEGYPVYKELEEIVVQKQDKFPIDKFSGFELSKILPEAIHN